VASKPSKAQQHKAVGEGLAVGCLILGRTELPSGKTDVELSFRRAWRTWPHARDFPAVKAGPERDDIYFQIMGDSASRRPPGIALWNVGRMLRPELTEGWDMADARDLLVQFYGIPVEAWVELARAFTDRLVGADVEATDSS